MASVNGEKETLEMQLVHRRDLIFLFSWPLFFLCRRVTLACPVMVLTERDRKNVVPGGKEKKGLLR